ncbi:MAG: serine/threonine-protein kinase, partial [Thermoanaerobaculia bacterium]
MTISSGTKLGSFVIVSRIGAGGMGEVWRAKDAKIGRDVAIKVLPASLVADADRLQRFEQEARAAGTLNHPNLVTIYELGTHDGAPFIAMELLEGETLRDKLDRGAIPARKSIDYAVQIANGLAAAHEKGIVHRDLKPENIFTMPDGRIKILDFGLAKLTAPADAPDDATAKRGTAPGTVMGTAGYMSPEQVLALEVDHRSDIFSFGAILYEMLSGHRAFRRDSSVETMNAILKEDPPELSVSGAQVSPAIDRIIRRCLEKNRTERIQNARDLAFALDGLSGTSATQSHPAGATSKSSRRTLLAAGAAAALLAVMVALFLAGRWSRPEPAQPTV